MAPSDGSGASTATIGPSASSVAEVWPRRMTASYRLRPPVSSSLNRVAAPTRIGRTPDARGSRVPAWPMRRVPVSRRMRPTMSWLVGPTGLSRLTTPSIGAVELALGFLQNEAHCLLEWGVHGRSCGSGMATAAERRGDRDRVGARRGPDAQPSLGAIGLLEEDRDVGSLRGCQQVDEPLAGHRLRPRLA